MKRARIAGVMTVAMAVGTLAGAPAALASTNYTWAGGDTNSASWQQGDNWLGGASPSGAIGTLSFPDLGAACDNGSSPDACYLSDDELGPLTANELTIDDDQAYSIYTTGGSTLTLTGGIEAAPTETTSDSMTGDPYLAVPLNLGANQSWNVDGGMQGDFGLEVPQITGNYGLQMGFADGGTLIASQFENRTLQVADGGNIVVTPLSDGAGHAGAELPAGGTQLLYAVSLYVTAPTTGGPLTTMGFTNAETTVSVESGEVPEAAVTLSGNASFDPYTDLYLELDNNDSNPADGGFSQIATTGANGIDLGGATLSLDQGWDDQIGDCTTLKPGDSFPIISAGGSLSGDLTYSDTSNNFDTLAPGQTSKPISVTLPAGCSAGAPASSATATLTYGAQSIYATIVAAPQSTQAPTISGTTEVGQTLALTSGGSWSGFPSATYAYQWLACASTCSPISGATGSTSC